MCFKHFIHLPPWACSNLCPWVSDTTTIAFLSSSSLQPQFFLHCSFSQRVSSFTLGVSIWVSASSMWLSNELVWCIWLLRMDWLGRPCNQVDFKSLFHREEKGLNWGTQLSFVVQLPRPAYKDFTENYSWIVMTLMRQVISSLALVCVFIVYCNFLPVTTFNFMVRTPKVAFIRQK